MVDDLKAQIGRGVLTVEKAQNLTVSPRITSVLQRKVNAALWASHEAAKAKAFTELQSAASVPAAKKKRTKRPK